MSSPNTNILPSAFPIGKKPIKNSEHIGSSQIFDIDDSRYFLESLPIPPNASSALVNIYAESGTYSDKDKVCRFTLDGTTPESDYGFVLGSGDYLRLETREQIDQFQFTSAETGIAGQLYVQYYV